VIGPGKLAQSSPAADACRRALVVLRAQGADMTKKEDKQLRAFLANMSFLPGYFWILNEAGEPQQTDCLTWATWLETAEATRQRQLADDYVGDGDARVRISTVFLGTNVSLSSEARPVLWETMVFGGPLDYAKCQYASRADALRGHVAMVQRVKEA
jgi:hypothetical protein